SRVAACSRHRRLSLLGLVLLRGGWWRRRRCGRLGLLLGRRLWRSRRLGLLFGWRLRGSRWLGLWLRWSRRLHLFCRRRGGRRARLLLLGRRPRRPLSRLFLLPARIGIA